MRPKFPEIKGAGRSADAAVGFLNGVLGSAIGLAGILPTFGRASVVGHAKTNEPSFNRPRSRRF
jgi:hypothetical protein